LVAVVFDVRGVCKKSLEVVSVVGGITGGSGRLL